MVLLTAFEPFAGRAVNQSERVARLVAEQPPRGVAVELAILPVRFAALARALPRLMAARAVVMLGESGRAQGLTFERVAVNLIDARIADNAGRRPIDVPVRERGPAAYFSTAPVKALAEAARRARAPVALSTSAGTYACNASYYLALHQAQRVDPHPAIVFIHVPQKLPATRRHLMAAGLRAVVAALGRD